MGHITRLTFVPIASVPIVYNPFSNLQEIKDADCKTNIKYDSIGVFVIDLRLQSIFWVNPERSGWDSDRVLISVSEEEEHS